MRFFLSDKSTLLYPNGPVVGAGSIIESPIEDFGDLAFKFLMVVNLSLEDQGSYEVESVEE